MFIFGEETPLMTVYHLTDRLYGLNIRILGVTRQKLAKKTTGIRLDD
jgi:hypothetical protein